ncbi:SacI homology domain-containing protein [Zopfochytrium polystomum]|nr:SacI homology domain-containing protein [Zopfochytrium polystomum]
MRLALGVVALCVVFVVLLHCTIEEGTEEWGVVAWGTRGLWWWGNAAEGGGNRRADTTEKVVLESRPEPTKWLLLWIDHMTLNQNGRHTHITWTPPTTQQTKTKTDAPPPSKSHDGDDEDRCFGVIADATTTNNRLTTKTTAAIMMESSSSSSFNDGHLQFRTEREVVFSAIRRVGDGSGGGGGGGEGKVLIFDSTGSWRVDSYHDPFMPTSEKVIEDNRMYGIIGVLDLGFGKYVFTVVEKEMAASIRRRTAWRIKGVKCVTVRRNFYLSLDEEEHERISIEQVTTVFTSGQFYFSLDFDLTSSVQLVAEKEELWSAELPSPPLHNIHSPDPRFFYNQFGSSVFDIEGLSYSVVLISRCSRERGGLQFRRGVNDAGNAAVEVETETVVFGLHHVCSHRMIRGSLPLKWKTLDSDGITSARIDLTDAATPRSARALALHLDGLNLRYGPGQITVIDLLPLGRADYERLGEIFERTLLNLQRPDVKYTHFDGGRMMGGDSRLLDRLRNYVQSPLQLQSFFCAPVDLRGRPTRPIQIQRGIFRLNGLNCVDTTNVAQHAIAELVVETMVSTMHCLSLLASKDPYGEGSPVSLQPLLSPGLDQSKKFSASLRPSAVKVLTRSNERRFAALWSANGDAISHQYIGTRAVQEAHLSGGSWWRRLVYLSSGKSITETAIRIARSYMAAFQYDRIQEGFELVLGPEDGGLFPAAGPTAGVGGSAPPSPPRGTTSVPQHQTSLHHPSHLQPTGIDSPLLAARSRSTTPTPVADPNDASEVHRRAMQRRRLRAQRENHQPTPMALTLVLRRFLAPQHVRGWLDFAAASGWLLLFIALKKIGLAGKGTGVFEAWRLGEEDLSVVPVGEVREGPTDAAAGAAINAALQSAGDTSDVPVGVAEATAVFVPDGEGEKKVGRFWSSSSREEARELAGTMEAATQRLLNMRISCYKISSPLQSHPTQHLLRDGFNNWWTDGIPDLRRKGKEEE